MGGRPPPLPPPNLVPLIPAPQLQHAAVVNNPVAGTPPTPPSNRLSPPQVRVPVPPGLQQPPRAVFPPFRNVGPVQAAKPPQPVVAAMPPPARVPLPLAPPPMGRAQSAPPLFRAPAPFQGIAPVRPGAQYPDQPPVPPGSAPDAESPAPVRTPREDVKSVKAAGSGGKTPIGSERPPKTVPRVEYIWSPYPSIFNNYHNLSR
ncbi:hypothetical protein NECAME_17297 [Necator americanus]|uniref:Uncharacterized protein n=1 Tax=Necator americanus TaxID=51031 RepID=W2TQB1_NECAM|nr:hypothetical protein NECAME_17297 [Necator americanus]ETN83993.1 hypothetical protein NECAME_17297 [Necator americanus]